MNYFLRRHSQAVDGPFPPTRIRAWRRDGQVNEATPVRGETEPEWCALGSVMELLLDPPEETVGRTLIGGLPAWRRGGLQPPGAPSPEVDAEEVEELTGFQWRIQIRALLSLLAFPISLGGEFLPLPGGSVFTSLGAFLLSAGPYYVAGPQAWPLDLQPYHHWIPVYLVLGLCFWPLLGVLQKRFEERRAIWASAALGFLLLDLAMQVVAGGLTSIPAMAGPLHLVVGIPLLIGAILMDFEALGYFYRYQRNSRRRTLEAAAGRWKLSRPKPATPPDTASAVAATPTQSPVDGDRPR